MQTSICSQVWRPPSPSSLLFSNHSPAELCSAFKVAGQQCSSALPTSRHVVVGKSKGKATGSTTPVGIVLFACNSQPCVTAVTGCVILEARRCRELMVAFLSCCTVMLAMVMVTINACRCYDTSHLCSGLWRYGLGIACYI